MSSDSADPPETKLTRSKRAWAGQGRFLTGGGQAGGQGTGRDRLPPGQHLVKDWPVLDLGIEPALTPGTWRLDVLGLVGRRLSLDWQAFAALPQVSLRSDIHCVTSWSRYDNDWQGVSTGQILAAAAPVPQARHVLLHGADGYVTNLPLADFARPEALLATHWQGAPLEPAHGGPVRAVVPHLYFWKSAKWLTRIELIGNDQAGFWERNGYHMRGDPWAEERYG